MNWTDGSMLVELRKPWNKCPNCHQYYPNELAVDLANKFVLNVKEQYPHNLVKQADTLIVKQRAIIHHTHWWGFATVATERG
jgi:gamma-glutamyl phosphate reductase